MPGWLALPLIPSISISESYWILESLSLRNRCTTASFAFLKDWFPCRNPNCIFFLSMSLAHTHTHTPISLYLSLSRVCVCVCSKNKMSLVFTVGQLCHKLPTETFTILNMYWATAPLTTFVWALQNRAYFRIKFLQAKPPANAVQFTGVKELRSPFPPPSAISYHCRKSLCT